MHTIILQASSRSNGNTHTIAQLVQSHLNADLIDLKQKTIHGYSYEHENADDDFLPTIREILQYDTLVFLTPVYWYAMSGILKNFFDRITDCLQTEKAMGRQLRGKNMVAISCGSDALETEGFFVPFRNSAEYLGMHYLGDLHTWAENGRLETIVKERIETFTSVVRQ